MNPRTRSAHTRLTDGRPVLLVRLDAAGVRCLARGDTCCLSVPGLPSGNLLLLLDAAEGSDGELKDDLQAAAGAIDAGQLLIQSGWRLP